MTERDEELSRIYRDAQGPRPPQRVDDNILAASQRVAGAMPRPAGVRFARRWGTPVALAATVLVTATLTLMVFERDSDPERVPKAPRARPAKVLSAEPKRADQPVPPPEKLQPIAPAPPIQPAAVLGTGRPASVPEVPRTPDALRRREEAKPAPAAAADANLLSSERPAVGQSAPAAAPAASANSPRESASTQSVRAAGAVRALATSEAKERTPEKWLEDIRKLRTEGKTTEAERDLAEFKKRYPDYILPEDLR